MATTTKTINKTQTTRRTLRSNAKPNNQQSLQSIDGSQQQKIINQIKIEIDHQQTNNATKFTGPICEEVKIENQLVLRKQSVTENYDDKKSFKKQSSFSDQHMFNLKQSILSLEAISNSIEEKIEVQIESKRSQEQNYTPKKTHLLKLQFTQISPYFQERKSYRKAKKDPLMVVPYRRLQDFLQQKIVTLINRICQNKSTEKQLSNFIEKLGKASVKDLYNPYVVSGIQTVLRLCEKSQQINVNSSLIKVNSLEKLRNEVNNMTQRIMDQLTATSEYENVFFEESQIDFAHIRPKMLRKIYQILIKQKNMNSSEAQSKSFYLCDSFFNKAKTQITYKELIQFLKESNFLQY